MQEHLTGPLLAQAADLPRRAPERSAPGPNRVKNGKFHMTQRIAGSHGPSVRAVSPGSSVAERAPERRLVCALAEREPSAIEA